MESLNNDNEEKKFLIEEKFETLATDSLLKVY